jgi:hypothetical protein
MQETLSRFQEVERILRENEQLHRRVACLEVENRWLSEELRKLSLQLEWIATIVKERPRPSME